MIKIKNKRFVLRVALFLRLSIDKWINHSNLLHCYQTTHGTKCALCEDETEVAERLHTKYQLDKLMTLQEAPKSLDTKERLRKEDNTWKNCATLIAMELAGCDRAFAYDAIFSRRQDNMETKDDIC